MTIEEMKSRKKELGYSNQTISDKSGIPLGTIQKIFAGQTQTPREDTIKALEKVLAPARSFHYNDFTKTSYTLEDYLALPDDQRVELIDGVFYDMAAPTTVHQALNGFIHKTLLDYVLEHGGPCMPLVSPVDVQLDADDKTVVQPDVLIVCDREKFQNGRVFGAPDFVVEVLSPSTARKDRRLKTYKYAEAGVKEYWMIDPDRKTIMVYDFSNDDIVTMYTFEDTVPVLIWDKKCLVDFKQIYQTISFLYY